MEFVKNKEAIISSTPQSEREKWLSERIGIITGTKYFGIMFSKTEEEKINHAKKICGLLEEQIPEHQRELVQFGLENEHIVRDQLSMYLCRDIYELGFIRSSPTSIFGCSVDGILDDGNIVELKTTIKPFPLESKSDYSEIPITHLWQMTNNCACTGARGCHYMSYHRNENAYYYRYVPFRFKIWLDISKKAIKFYKKYVVPIYDISTRQIREQELTEEEASLIEYDYFIKLHQPYILNYFYPKRPVRNGVRIDS